MGTQCFVEPSAIAVREYILETTRVCRAEKKLRRAILGQRNPDCSGLRRLRGYPLPTNGLGYITLQTSTTNRNLYFRPQTSDERVLRQIFEEWDYDLTRLPRWPGLRDFLEARHNDGRRPLIIDAGANVGASAVFFALTFPTAVVVAIEPEEGNFALLCRNTEGLNVICIKAALSCESGHASLINTGEEPWAFRTRRVESSDGLPCTTIDSIYEDFLDAHVFPFLTKIDIEGAEEDVFMRNTAWVNDTPLVIIELHDWLLPGQGTSLPFLRCVSSLDRDFVHFGENVFSIDNALSSSTARPTALRSE
jgi:FkbM family methyltransferase